jgi:exopolysaccharide biosynthesis predicted pyruvyltransferase EpsI
MIADSLTTCCSAATLPSSTLFGPDDPYVRFLQDNRHCAFYMKPWNGNSGDVLIWLGTEQLLEDLHIHRTLDPHAAQIVLVPGGNQTMWQGNIDIWKDAWSRWPEKDFVVGPTTIWLGLTRWEQEIQRRHARVTALFARDPGSYAILQTCRLDGDITLGLSHDPALYLRDSELIARHREAATDEFVLAAFRDDFEGLKDPQSRRAQWLKLVPSYVQRQIQSLDRRTRRQSKIARAIRCTRSTKPLRVCDASTFPFPYFLETVRSAEEVHTDRLHVMLLAAMLGKPTFAYGTHFRKLENVYHHSVKSWARVEFINDV